MNRYFYFFILMSNISFFSYADKVPNDLLEDLKKGISFTATIGDVMPQARMWLKSSDGKQVTGFYRYEKSECNLTLSGTLATATQSITLLEKDCKGQTVGRFELKISETPHGTQTLAGDWHSALDKKHLSVWLDRSDWIWLTDWIWISPQQLVNQPHDRCKTSRRWPQFIGVKPAVKTLLNKHFAPQTPLKADRAFCDDFYTANPISSPSLGELNENFSLLGMRDNMVSLELSTYQYSGGAHGISNDLCQLMDLSTGNEIKLGQLIDPKQKPKLRAIVEKQLLTKLKDPSAAPTQTLQDVGVWPDSFNKAMQTPQLCLRGTGLGGYIQFGEYEIAPYSYGMPTADIDENQLKDILVKNATTAKLFSTK